jgi:hypothetical protein
MKNNWPGSVGSGNTWADRIPDGTHPADMLYGTASSGFDAQFIGAGSGRLVFGVQLNDATIVADWYAPVGNDHPTFGAYVEPDDFHIDRWSGRIAVDGSDVFIANNVIPAPTRNFVHSQYTLLYNGSGFSNLQIRDILFDYSQVIGIDVNKNHLALAQPTEPDSGYYEPNIHVWDNFVFNRGSHGFTVSGQWASVLNNHNQRYYYGTIVPAAYGISGYTGTETVVCTKDGFGTYAAESGTDFNSRGYDFGGRNLWVGNNSVVNTGSIGNDGEAFMGQRYLGFEVYSWAFTDNLHTKQNFGTGTQGENGWIGSYDMQNYGFLALRNTTPGWIGHTKAGSNNLYDFSLVENIAGSGLKSEAGGVADVDISSHAKLLPLPEEPSVSPQTDGSNLVEYADMDDDELGYRIARRIDGGLWGTLVYRPRQSLLAEVDPAQTDPWSTVPVRELNPPQWRDYTIPHSAAALEYAVIPINADDMLSLPTQVPLLAGAGGEVRCILYRGYNYRLWRSENLTGWDPVTAWTAGDSVGSAPSSTLLFTEPAGTPAAFFRLEISN